MNMRASRFPLRKLSGTPHFLNAAQLCIFTAHEKLCSRRCVKNHFNSSSNFLAHVEMLKIKQSRRMSWKLFIFCGLVHWLPRDIGRCHNRSPQNHLKASFPLLGAHNKRSPSWSKFQLIRKNRKVEFIEYGCWLVLLRELESPLNSPILTILTWASSPSSATFQIPWIISRL